MTTPDPGSDHLLYCLSGRYKQTAAEASLSISPVVWERTGQLAQRHKVEPLLYARIKPKGNSTVIPTTICQTLQQATHLNALKMANLYRELAAILHLLNQAAVPVIVLKGAYLGPIVYPNTAFRSMGDIDLLVRQHDLARTTTLLQSHGYCLQNKMWGVKHLTFAAADGRPPVEIHWHILHPADPFDIDVDELWARAVPVTLVGAPVLALSPEDLILHLALHTSFNHGFCFGLRPFCDIQATINFFGDAIVWAIVVRRAHRWQMARALFLTLYLAADLLATAMPNEALLALQPDDFKSEMAVWARERILGGNAIPFISSNFSRMWEEKRLWSKAAVFLKCILPPPEMLAEQSQLSPTHPIRQLGERIRRYGPVGWRLWQHDEAICCDVNMKKWLASS